MKAEPQDWGDDCFYCMNCKQPFRTPLFDVTRSIEQMHYYGEERMPEAEVLQAESIAVCCSQSCFTSELPSLLQNEGVRATYPGPGPIELCARCGKPVDMSVPHFAWTEEYSSVIWSAKLDAVQPLAVTMLAIACTDCGRDHAQVNTAEERQNPEVADLQRKSLLTLLSSAPIAK